jgi:hypothetical protein
LEDIGTSDVARKAISGLSGVPFEARFWAILWVDVALVMIVEGSWTDSTQVSKAN